METLSWLCLFLPLAGVALLALLHTRVTREVAAWLGTGFAFAAFLCAAIVFFQILGEDESSRGHVFTLYTWAGSPSFHVPLMIQVDQLAVVEMLIVSGIGSLIVMYSIGYMHGDPKERRFFAYLDMFLFSMLLLVMAGNFVLLLAGWGLVGLSSYLLIGFWHEQRAPVVAAKKAFVMNAIGDVGIAIAIFFMVRDLGTTDYHAVFTKGPEVWAKGGDTANWVAFLLLVGAVAKSAQIPLHTWLPDAMEGPTPVSALIHAATMVTAGVYLVARCHVLFANAPDIASLTALLGVATLLMAGVIAVVQTDIKRIIAYSTMSQIGYMFAAVGVGEYAAGMFHLLTHAFFKALLFLGAGIVIHALANEQDVRRMGGLSKVMPHTTKLMWVGTIALIGFFPLSKDEILAGAMESGSTTAWIVWAGGLIGAFFTGIYATRLMRLVFYGDMSDFAKEHLHTGHGEAPWTMFWPVCVLAAGAILSGFLALGFGFTNFFADFLANTAPDIEASVADDSITTLISWSVSIIGAWFVWNLYAAPGRSAALRQAVRRDDHGSPTTSSTGTSSTTRSRTGRRLPRHLDEPGGRGLDHRRLRQGDRLRGRHHRPAGRRGADRGRPRVRRRRRAGRADRRRLPPEPGVAVTTALILLPLIAGLVVGLAPLERRTTEGLALLAALVECALGVVALIQFDSDKGTQFVTDKVWITDFLGIADVRFHVGMGGLSLFMVLLTAVGVAAAAATASWAGRERPRVYFALLLGLECALVLLFTARDIVLFYVGWEAMMIPLYVLIAVWGGEQRRRATLTFFIYTLIGSLLMLVAVAWVGIHGNSFQIDVLTGAGLDSTWPFLAFCAAFCIKAPLFPLHGWLPITYRQAAPETTALLSGVISKAGAYGLIAIAIPLFAPNAVDLRWWFVGLALAGLLYGSLIAFRQPDARGVVAYSSLGQMNLIVIGIFASLPSVVGTSSVTRPTTATVATNDNGITGAKFQMVNHGLVSLAAFLLIGLIELRCGTDAFKYLGGLANGRPVISTVFLITALFALAVPGSAVFVSELYILIGAFQFQALVGAAAACAIVLAAMYMLRWYSALVHEGDGPNVSPETPDLRLGELGIAVPLVLILLVLSAYPFGVMERLGGFG